METIGYLGFSKFLIEREEEVREIEGGKNIFDKKDCVMRKFVIFKFQHVYPFLKKKKRTLRKLGCATGRDQSYSAQAINF